MSEPKCPPLGGPPHPRTQSVGNLPPGRPTLTGGTDQLQLLAVQPLAGLGHPSQRGKDIPGRDLAGRQQRPKPSSATAASSTLSGL
ncbi:hypothetical protein [Streptomyces sp. NPDC091278]|uniref:hypothetical protein n=1 Tax=Streptomyces sp. NPDC091278 TaxID=3155301 RepID=UPI00344CB4AC